MDSFAKSLEFWLNHQRKREGWLWMMVYGTRQALEGGRNQAHGVTEGKEEVGSVNTASGRKR